MTHVKKPRWSSIFSCICTNREHCAGAIVYCIWSRVIDHITEVIVVADINECLETEDNRCDANAYCTNEQGSYDCTCNSGYAGDGFQMRRY